MFLVTSLIVALCCLIRKQCCGDKTEKSKLEEINWKELEKSEQKIGGSTDDLSQSNHAQLDNNSHAAAIDLKDIGVNIPVKMMSKGRKRSSQTSGKQLTVIESLEVKEGERGDKSITDQEKREKKEGEN